MTYLYLLSKEHQVALKLMGFPYSCKSCDHYIQREKTLDKCRFLEVPIFPNEICKWHSHTPIDFPEPDHEQNSIR
jgi:hypothetical protein